MLSDDPETYAKALEAAKKQCERWHTARHNDATTERVGTEVQRVMIAKFVRWYLADFEVPKARRTKKEAIFWAVKQFGVSPRAVHAAVSIERAARRPRPIPHRGKASAAGSKRGLCKPFA